MLERDVKGERGTLEPGRPGLVQPAHGGRTHACSGFTNPSGVVCGPGIADAEQHVRADVRRRPVQADPRD